MTSYQTRCLNSPSEIKTLAQIIENPLNQLGSDPEEVENRENVPISRPDYRRPEIFLENQSQLKKWRKLEFWIEGNNHLFLSW